MVVGYGCDLPLSFVNCRLGGFGDWLLGVISGAMILIWAVLLAGLLLSVLWGLFGSALNSVGIYGSLFVGLILVWLDVVVRCVVIDGIACVQYGFVCSAVGWLFGCCLPLIGCGSWVVLLGLVYDGCLL